MRAGLATLRSAIAERPRLVLTALAALAFALALARPTLPWPSRVGSTLFVVDITQSMNVADAHWDGRTVSRLAFARELLHDVLRRLPCGHAAGLAVFTERKTMALLAPVEVCAHQAALADALGALDTRMAWAADSHIHYGSYSALDTIEARWPGTALAFLTDGDQAPAIFPGREPRYERHVTSPHGVLLGIGGEVPQPVPKFDTDGRPAGHWTAEDTRAFSSTGAPTLSVADMERMAGGGDVRNQSQRAPGTQADHLSPRRDAVLDAVARATGLQTRTATDAASVIAAVESLPGARRVVQRVELHAALVALGALALIASLLPAPRRRSARPPLSSSTHRTEVNVP